MVAPFGQVVTWSHFFCGSRNNHQPWWFLCAMLVSAAKWQGENHQTTRKREKCLNNLLPVALSIVLHLWTAKYFNCQDHTEEAFRVCCKKSKFLKIRFPINVFSHVSVIHLSANSLQVRCLASTTFLPSATLFNVMNNVVMMSLNSFPLANNSLNYSQSRETLWS